MIDELARFFMALVRLAVEGDPVAMAKLKDVLPETLYTEMVARRQDIVAEMKFGPRP